MQDRIKGFFPKDDDEPENSDESVVLPPGKFPEEAIIGMSPGVTRFLVNLKPAKSKLYFQEIILRALNGDCGDIDLCDDYNENFILRTRAKKPTMSVFRPDPVELLGEDNDKNPYYLFLIMDPKPTPMHVMILFSIEYGMNPQTEAFIDKLALREVGEYLHECFPD